MRRFWLWLLALVGCAPTVYTNGVPNFAEVSPGLYRSGQPTDAGWVYLKSLGVKTVVKLNFEPTEGSDDTARSLGMDVHALSIQPEGDQDVWDDVLGTFKKPNGALLAEAVRLLRAATPDNATLVHCSHGQDRTGLAVGMYRRSLGWSKDRAWDEMIGRGFHPELVGLTTFWAEDVK